IRMVEDTPEEVAHELLTEKAFLGHPLSRSVLGTPASVTGLDRSMLRAYMAERYRGPHLVVAAAGRVDHDDVVRLVEEHMEAFPAGDGEPGSTRPLSFAPRQYWRE